MHPRLRERRSLPESLIDACFAEAMAVRSGGVDMYCDVLEVLEDNETRRCMHCTGSGGGDFILLCKAAQAHAKEKHGHLVHWPAEGLMPLRLRLRA